MSEVRGQPWVGAKGRRRPGSVVPASDPRILVALLPLCLSTINGCGTTTPFRGEGFSGGFVEEQVAGDEFWVSFDGNTALDREALQQSLMRRASELTLRHGFTHFVVLSRGQQVGFGFRLTPQVIGPLRRTGRSLLIRCYTGDPGEREAVDADRFLHSQEPLSGRHTL